MYHDLQQAIVDARDAAGYDFPVYVNPLDAVETPCVMILAGKMEPHALSNSIMHSIRVNAIALRPDAAGAIELTDDISRILRSACSILTPAGWSGAQPPATFGIGGVDYIGRENTITLITN